MDLSQTLADVLTKASHSTQRITSPRNYLTSTLKKAESHGVITPGTVAMELQHYGSQPDIGWCACQSITLYSENNFTEKLLDINTKEGREPWCHNSRYSSNGVTALWISARHWLMCLPKRHILIVTQKMTSLHQNLGSLSQQPIGKLTSFSM